MAHANSPDIDKYIDDQLRLYLDQTALAGVDTGEQVTITLTEQMVNEIEVWITLADATHVTEKFKNKRAKEIISRIGNIITYNLEGVDNDY